MSKSSGISPLLAKPLSFKKKVPWVQRKYYTKGISPLLATVLLIAATVVVSTMVAGWLSSTTSATQSAITNKTNEGVACAAAEIIIDDVYITAGTTTETASVILRNSGSTDDLTITSAQLYNKNGDNITATNVPISNFDRGATSTLSFSFGGPAKDVSGKGNNGTIVNNVALSQGRYSSGLSFDGSGDYLNVSHSASLNITGRLTLEAWVKTTSNGVFVGKTNESTYLCYGLGTNVYSSGQLELFIVQDADCNGGSGQIEVGVSSIDIKDGQWHHVAGTFNGTNSSIYVDGIDRTNNGNMYHYSNANSIGSNAYPIRIGGGGRGGDMNGNLDDIAIWNRSLTNAEINTSMNQGPLSVSNTNDLVAYWNPDGSIVACPSDFSRVVVTTNCGGVSAEFSKRPKC